MDKSRKPDNAVNSITVKSPVFAENTLMPRKYSCQGDDVNPPLEFSGIPGNAKSLVLIMDDPDAAMGWDHWLMFNIPVIAEIAEDTLPKDAVLGVNSWGNNAYGGPCPPSGTHRYVFRVYALDTHLELDEGASRRSIEAAMHGHILVQGQLIGLYRKA